jgi:hypothetical protein
MWGINVFIMQIDYVKILYKEDVHIWGTNFAKQMERNLHETISQWKTNGKRLYSEDLEVQDDALKSLHTLEIFEASFLSYLGDGRI